MLKPSQAAILLGCTDQLYKDAQNRGLDSWRVSNKLTIKIAQNIAFRSRNFLRNRQKHYYLQPDAEHAGKTALQKVKPSPVQRPLDSYTDAERKEIGFGGMS